MTAAKIMMALGVVGVLMVICASKHAERDAGARPGEDMVPARKEDEPPGGEG